MATMQSEGFERPGNEMDNYNWSEYDGAAEWCARRNLRGEIGDPLPAMLSAPVLNAINYDPEAFQCRVSQMAYALAMLRHSET